MAVTARTFNETLCQRVQELRQARGWTQEQMARALDIPLDRYKKYEVRSPLPPHLIERFAMLVGREISYVLTGKLDLARRGPRVPAVQRPAERKKGQR